MIDPDTNLFIYEINRDLPDPIPDPPNSLIGVWNEETFSYVFFSEPEDQYIANLCSSYDFAVGSRHEMKYRDWQEGLPDGGLNICGVKFVPSSNSISDGDAIFLDPSVVFGDGNHPTTRSCIEFLVEITKNRCVKSVLDLGSGSGILALVSAKLGSTKVVAVDKNRLAVQATKRNVELNAMSQLIKVREGEARVYLGEEYDLVLANLPFGVLRDLVVLKEASFHKIWIVSGINSEQASVLKTLFHEQCFIITREQATPPWVTFVAAQKKFWSELLDENKI